jgi:hypothetical protein
MQPYPTLEVLRLFAAAGVLAAVAGLELRSGRRRWAECWLAAACGLCLVSIAFTVARHYVRFGEQGDPKPVYLKPIDGVYDPPIKPASELFDARGNAR